MGMGPMTGRGAGLCAGSNVPGFANRGFGLFGRGRGGGGRGWRNRFYATGLTGWQRAAMDAVAAQAVAAVPTTDEEKQTLTAQLGAMQSQLEAISQRLARLEDRK
jgi:hypothetical protein